MNKTEVIAELLRMSELEFIDFFYEATAQRDTAKYPYDVGRYLLCEARRKEGQAWELDILAAAKSDAAYIGEVPIKLKGACGACGIQIRTWDRKAACPGCGNSVSCA